MVALRTGRKRKPAERQMVMPFPLGHTEWAYVFEVATATARKMGLSEDDAADAALRGLLYARERFDPCRPVKFETLATGKARFSLSDIRRGRGRRDALDHAVTVGVEQVWTDREWFADADEAA